MSSTSTGNKQQVSDNTLLELTKTFVPKNKHTSITSLTEANFPPYLAFTVPLRPQRHEKTNQELTGIFLQKYLHDSITRQGTIFQTSGKLNLL